MMDHQRKVNVALDDFKIKAAEALLRLTDTTELKSSEKQNLSGEKLFDPRPCELEAECYNYCNHFGITPCHYELLVIIY